MLVNIHFQKISEKDSNRGRGLKREEGLLGGGFIRERGVLRGEYLR